VEVNRLNFQSGEVMVNGLVSERSARKASDLSKLDIAGQPGFRTRRARM